MEAISKVFVRKLATKQQWHLLAAISAAAVGLSILAGYPLLGALVLATAAWVLMVAHPSLILHLLFLSALVRLRAPFTLPEGTDLFLGDFAMVAAIPALSIALVARRGRLIARPEYLVAASIVVTSAALSLLANVPEIAADPASLKAALGQTATYLILLAAPILVASHLRTVPALRALTNSLLVAALVVSLIGGTWIVSQGGGFSYGNRVVLLFADHPLPISVCGIYLACYGIGGLAGRSPKPTKWIVLIGLGAFAVASVFSRSGIITLILMLAIGTVMFKATTRLRRLGATSALAALAGVAAWFPGSHLRFDEWRDVAETMGLLPRIDVYIDALRIFCGHPLLGVGPGQYFRFSSGWIRWSGVLHIVSDPHSTFLRLLSEQGILGATAYVALASTCILIAWRALKKHQSSSEALQHVSRICFLWIVSATLKSLLVGSLLLQMRRGVSDLTLLMVGVCMALLAPQEKSNSRSGDAPPEANAQRLE